MNFKYFLQTLALLFFIFNQAHASLLISPIRLVMTEQDHTGEITLVNTSNTTNSYKIEWIEYHQDEHDRYVIDKDNKSPSSRMLSYSPRQVTLEPKQSQKVRLRYRASRVEDGEYRSHLRMTALAQKLPSPTADEAPVAEKSSMSIKVQLSFDLPIIVRKGAGDASIELGDVLVVPGIKGNSRSMAKMKIPFHHSGSFSTTGSLIVLMQNKPGAALERIGILNNLNVFPDSSTVMKTVPLNISHIPPGAAIKISYEGRKEYKEHLFAEKVFQYNP